MKVLLAAHEGKGKRQALLCPKSRDSNLGCYYPMEQVALIFALLLSKRLSNQLCLRAEMANLRLIDFGNGVTLRDNCLACVTTSRASSWSRILVIILRKSARL